MLEKIRTFLRERPWLKRAVGVLCIVLGLLALVTPLTPGSWLVFVGLELLGIRWLAWDKVRAWWKKRDDSPDTPV